MGTDPTPLSPTRNTGSKGDKMETVPEWLGRMWVHEALKSCGVPWVPGAAWRRPGEGWMGLDDRHRAIEIAGRVWRAMQRRVPGGLPASALNPALRDVAWQCTVAGLALLDRSRWPSDSAQWRAEEADKELEAQIMSPSQNPRAAIRLMPSTEPIVIHRRGEARRAI
jgi:hypothetical protein